MAKKQRCEALLHRCQAKVTEIEAEVGADKHALVVQTMADWLEAPRELSNSELCARVQALQAAGNVLSSAKKEKEKGTIKALC